MYVTTDHRCFEYSTDFRKVLVNKFSWYSEHTVKMYQAKLVRQTAVINLKKQTTNEIPWIEQKVL